MNKIKAVIFDMDGVIIDSEPLWKIAIINVMKQEGFDFTIAMCNRTKGMRMDEVSVFWKEELNANFSPKKITKDVIHELINLVKKQGKAIAGLLDLLHYFKDQNLKIALASSSSMQIINTVLEKLEIREYFEVIHSAETEEYGKPHPQVFITTANMLNISPENCLVIEDSLHGVIAGKAAKMKVIAMPEIGEPKLNKFTIADEIVNSLVDIINLFKN